MLAYIVADCRKLPMSGKRGVSSYHSVAPWFQNIDEFAELFNGKHVKFDVGYHPTMLQASKFLRLSLPLAYLLIKLPVETMATMNRLYAFLFLLDFCTSIATSAPIIWGEEQVTPS
jgi:hypothetical protein